MNNALVKVDSVRADIVPLPPYDAEHLEALGKKFCTRIGMPDELFEDAVQEFVLGGLVALKKLEVICLGASRTYQHKYGESYVRKFLEREGKYRKRHCSVCGKHTSDSNSIDEIWGVIEDPSSIDPVEEAIINEEIELLSDIVIRLPEKDRDILHAWLDEGLSFRELGDRYRITKSGAHVIIKRIIGWMRNEGTTARKERDQ